jgi:hypothetical protein
MVMKDHLEVRWIQELVTYMRKSVQWPSTAKTVNSTTAGIWSVATQRTLE